MHIPPPSDQPERREAANTEGFAYVTQKILYYAALESLLFGNGDDNFTPAFREHVLELYQSIIDFQAQNVLRFFRGRFRNLMREVVKWDPWEDMLKMVKELGANVERESIHISLSLSRDELAELVEVKAKT